MLRILEANLLMLFCWLPAACWLTTGLLGVYESIISGDIDKFIVHMTAGGLYGAIYAFFAYLLLFVVFLIWDYALLEAGEAGLIPFIIVQTIVVCIVIILVATWKRNLTASVFVLTFGAAQFQKYKYLKRNFGKP